MAKRSIRLEGIAPEWFQMVREGQREANLATDAALAEHLGLERVDVHRLFHGDVYERTVRRAVERLHIPPPLVPIRHRDDPELLDLLHRLRRLSPEKYLNQVTRLRAIVAGEEAERDM